MAVKDKRIRAPRTDAYKVSVKEMDIIEGLNIRTDLGDLTELIEIMLTAPDKIPPLRGFKKGGRYVIVQGHRRRAAALLAQKTSETDIMLWVLPETKGYTDLERTVDMFVSNDGKKLTLLEQAAGVRILQDKYNMHEKDIAKRIYKSVTYVRNCIKLLQAPADIQELMREDLLSPTTVIQLIKDLDLDAAVQAIRDTIESMQTNAPAPKAVQPELEFSQTNENDNLSFDQGVAGAARINPTNTDMVALPFEDREPPQQMKSKITKKDIDQTLKKVNSVSIFKKLISHSEAEIVLEEKAEEFVFLQRVIEGNVAEEEMTERYFGKKTVETKEDELF